MSLNPEITPWKKSISPQKLSPGKSSKDKVRDLVLIRAFFEKFLFVFH